MLYFDNIDSFPFLLPSMHKSKINETKQRFLIINFSDSKSKIKAISAPTLHFLSIWTIISVKNMTQEIIVSFDMFYTLHYGRFRIFRGINETHAANYDVK